MEVSVSVIIPAYNCKTYIKTAVQSVLEQTVEPLEILVIDDGSTDGTEQVLNEMAQNCSKLRLIKLEVNSGVSAARNRGVKEAKGKWVAFLDSDDQWVPAKLEKQLAMMEKTGAVFGFTGSSFVDENGEPYESVFSVPETVDRTRLFDQNVISCSSVIILREIICRYPMKSEDIHEDFDTWLRVLEEVPAAYGLNEPLLIYRLSSGSKSGNKLKSFQMNYRTYRSVGLGPLKAAKHMYRYTINGLKKYRNIKKRP